MIQISRKLISSIPLIWAMQTSLALLLVGENDIKPTTHKKHFVVGELHHQLGNQMFEIAATASIAWDNNADPIFPDLNELQTWNIPINKETILWKVDSDKPWKRIRKIVRYKNLDYRPIEYCPNMKLYGFFQSDKYFKHNKEKILDLFEPNPTIVSYLKENYASILDHPNTVGVHVRTYAYEEEIYYTCINFLGMPYFEKAMSLFPDDSLFVIFSDQIEWCRQKFSHLPYQMVFIENEPYYNDFTLMSFCKNNIISNSTFSWWAAYLNPNGNKVVIAPSPWYLEESYWGDSDIIPEDEGWFTLRYGYRGDYDIRNIE